MMDVHNKIKLHILGYNSGFYSTLDNHNQVGERKKSLIDESVCGGQENTKDDDKQLTGVQNNIGRNVNKSKSFHLSRDSKSHVKDKGGTPNHKHSKKTKFGHQNLDSNLMDGNLDLGDSVPSLKRQESKTPLLKPGNYKNLASGSLNHSNSMFPDDSAPKVVFNKRRKMLTFDDKTDEMHLQANQLTYIPIALREFIEMKEKYLDWNDKFIEELGDKTGGKAKQVYQNFEVPMFQVNIPRDDYESLNDYNNPSEW